MEYFQYLRQFVGSKPLLLPGSVVIVRNAKGEVLLQKRPEGRWGLPGGLMNLGESFEEVAIREVFEETGLELRNLTLLQVYSGKEFYTKATNGDEYYNITAVFMAKEVAGNLQSNDQETVALRYFHVDDLPEQIIGSHYHFIQQFKENLFEM